jgi:hypothetical protein
MEEIVRDPDAHATFGRQHFIDGCGERYEHSLSRLVAQIVDLDRLACAEEIPYHIMPQRIDALRVFRVIIRPIGTLHVRAGDGRFSY